MEFPRISNHHDIDMITIDVSGEGSTMSIVSRSYFLAQLILILCDRVEKKCEVMHDYQFFPTKLDTNDEKTSCLFYNTERDLEP